MRKFYLLTFALVFAFSANAQFSGDFAPANWTLTGTSAASDASVDTTNAPTSITFNGNDSDFGDCCDLQDDYTVTVPSDGLISFTYDFVNPDIEEFYYVINGTQSLITVDTETGTVSDITVSSGDTFAFRIYTEDDCCGRGVATISNFSFSNTLGTNDNNLLSNTLKLYPGTTNGTYNLEYNGNTNLDSFSVYNITGKLIKVISLKDVETTPIIDLTSLSAGIYLVNINSTEGIITKKIVL
jgi:hypothetical protein